MAALRPLLGKREMTSFQDRKWGFGVALSACVFLTHCASSHSERIDDDPASFGSTAGALGTPLASCSSSSSSGYASSTKTLALSLDFATTNQIVLSATNGEVRVNNHACVTAGGVTLKIADVARIEVTGTTHDDLVILDLLYGPFGSALTGSSTSSAAHSAGIAIDLAAGSGDRVSLRGTTGADTHVIGSDGSRDFVDFTGDAKADVVIVGAESLADSAAEGNDTTTGQGTLPGAASAMTATAAVASTAVTSGMGPTSLPLFLFGGAGNDKLYGGSGNDALDGMEGDDTLYASGTTSADGNDTFVGGAGTDTADYSTRLANTYLSIGTSRSSVRAASKACDSLVTTNKGDDGLYTSSGQSECDDLDATIENLIGGAVTDVLIGSTSSNVLTGGGGSDYLWGGPAGSCSATVDVDVLNGGAGDDVFMPLLQGSGASSDCRDTYNGGSGTDVVLYTWRTSAVVMAPSGASTSGEAGEGDTIAADIEVLFGGAANDTLTANAAGTTLFGCAGNDVLTGAAGKDTFFGGPGNDLMNGNAGDDLFVEKGTVSTTMAGFFDVLTAGEEDAKPPTAFDSTALGCKAVASEAAMNNGDGADRMNGGTGGEDTVDYGAYAVARGSYVLTSSAARQAAVVMTLCASATTSTATYGAAIACSSGTASGDGESGENDDVVNIVRVYGGAGGDTITGAATNDMLYGFLGDDTLSGGAGNDTLVGGATGSAEANVLSGGTGDDICVGEGSGSGAALSGCELLSGMAQLCASPTSSEWTCGSALIAASSVWYRAAYVGNWQAREFSAGSLDAVNASTSRSATCASDSWRLNDGTYEVLVTRQSRSISCDGSYDFTLVGRINTQFQRNLFLQVYFGDPFVASSLVVHFDRWVWNSAGEAGANVSLVDNFATVYSYRLDWWQMPSTNEWFDLRLQLDTVNDTCVATFTSTTHVRTHSFACALPDAVAPWLVVGAGGPAQDRGGAPDADIIGLLARPPLSFW